MDEKQEQAIIKINGERFFCECGVGVFTVISRDPHYLAECNGCKARYSDKEESHG
jgi:hypothetical protein